MRTRYKIIIVIVAGFVCLSLFHLSLYKTWGNNEHYYLPVNGMEVVCNVNLWQNPSNCHPINEKGETVEWPDNIGHLGRNSLGGGAIDLDPDLSPSYSQDFPNGLIIGILLPLTPLFAGIATLFLVPYFILKRKNIPSRPYLVLSLAGILLFFGIPNVVTSLGIFSTMLSQPEQIPTWVFNPQFVLLMIPIILSTIAGIMLYRSSVIRKLIKKRK